jgi:AraC-like DNA-binding protein
MCGPLSPRGGPHSSRVSTYGAQISMAPRKIVFLMTRLAARNLNPARSSGLISRLAYARGKQAGVNVENLLKRSGLAVNDIRNDCTRLNIQKQIRFIGLVAEALRDDNLGFHLAQGFDLREIGFLYYVAGSAATLGDALQRVQRYSTIVNEGIAIKVRRKESLDIHFEYRGVARHTDTHQIEFWITAFLRTIRQLTNRKINPLRVRVVHHRIDTKNEFGKFIGVRIEANSRADVVDFAGSYWNVPILNADPYLHRLLLQVCEEALARGELPMNSLRATVQNAIVELLPHGDANIKRVATKLGVSSRTLARRLSFEHLSFRELLQDLRSALAHRYLADQNLRISQIAWLLGYKDVAAFTRAFQRWTGSLPSKNRSQRQHSITAR